MMLYLILVPNWKSNSSFQHELQFNIFSSCLQSSLCASYLKFQQNPCTSEVVWLLLSIHKANKINVPVLTLIYIPNLLICRATRADHRLSPARFEAFLQTECEWHSIQPDLCNLKEQSRQVRAQKSADLHEDRWYHHVNILGDVIIAKLLSWLWHHSLVR